MNMNQITSDSEKNEIITQITQSNITDDDILFDCDCCKKLLPFDKEEGIVTATICSKCNNMICEQCSFELGNPPKPVCKKCYQKANPKKPYNMMDIIKKEMIKKEIRQKSEK